MIKNIEIGKVYKHNSSFNGIDFSTKVIVILGVAPASSDIISDFTIDVVAGELGAVYRVVRSVFAKSCFAFTYLIAISL